MSYPFSSIPTTTLDIWHRRSTTWQIPKPSAMSYGKTLTISSVHWDQSDSSVAAAQQGAMSTAGAVTLPWACRHSSGLPMKKISWLPEATIMAPELDNGPNKRKRDSSAQQEDVEMENSDEKRVCIADPSIADDEKDQALKEKNQAVKERDEALVRLDKANKEIRRLTAVLACANEDHKATIEDLEGQVASFESRIEAV
ncbi:hypothetical protein F4778DRAFT_309700 [Xylariomycetidae sp. FL2044]|nr:hypothetical protein F4778DRAFT_309700 [Xylariomycetidae sp. FL2044]